MMKAQTFAEGYAQIHNADIDVILELTAKKDAATYYEKYVDRRVAEHLQLCKRVTHPSSDRFFVEAIHAHPDIDGTTFTQEELQRAAKTLSFRPINVDHNPKYGQGKHLPFPANSTLWMTYDPLVEGVTGVIQM